ncbi:hypothetical protein GCWU000321_01824 [Dialister invisus DSM 15470]|uniref:Uncharacterized protein n=1 Tax=Dialister invisus DSM 15470 TaxID=592028 RepID=C9LQJ2_9FIRM|nr:hypothetical protein GCWU000321_01824 [Dialister invisus DSM 15470]
MFLCFRKLFFAKSIQDDFDCIFVFPPAPLFTLCRITSLPCYPAEKSLIIKIYHFLF